MGRRSATELPTGKTLDASLDAFYIRTLGHDALLQMEDFLRAIRDPRDIRAWISGDPTEITVAQINAATSDLAASGGGVLYLPGGLVYEIDEPVLLRSRVHIKGDGPGLYFGGRHYGTLFRLADGANCNMVETEATTSHFYGLRQVGLEGNRNNQAADDATYATDYAGIWLNSVATPNQMNVAHPGIDVGGHCANLEHIVIKNVAGSGMVVGAARETYFHNIEIHGSRRYGLRSSSTDSRWTNLVVATSDWIGMLTGTPGGTTRYANVKSWFSGVKSWTEWDAFQDHVTANDLAGSYNWNSKADLTEPPWGVDFALRTAGCRYTGFQSQDSDGTGCWINTSRSTLEVTTDSPGNLYAASSGNSGGLLQGNGIRTAPTSANRKHLMVVNCNGCDITLNADCRVAPSLAQWIVELVGTNTGCIIKGTHDYAATSGELTGTIPPSTIVMLPKTRSPYPRATTTELQTLAHFVNVAWQTDGSISSTPSYKATGAIVFNTTDNKLYVAQGALPASTWVSMDGGTTITPNL